MDVHPLTPERLPDLAKLFATSAITRRCHCTYFLISGRKREEVWQAGCSQAWFEQVTREESAPTGVLAYRGTEPVGWCAAGPRSRYPKVLRSPLWKDRNPYEDDSSWLVSCFYVRASARHAGLSATLLNGAVMLAMDYGATTIEGMPRSETGAEVDASSSFVGFERVFVDCGFTVSRRPSKQRVLMRLELDR